MGARGMHMLLCCITLGCVVADVSGLALTRDVPEDPPVEDGRVLWLPALNNDCATTCQGMGFQPVGPPEGPMCLGTLEVPPYYPPGYEPPYPPEPIGWQYPGTLRATSKVCAFAGDSNSELGPHTSPSFYCGCVVAKPNVPSEADLAWAPQGTVNCPAGYSPVPSVCRAKVGKKVLYGWVAREIDVCVVNFANQQKSVEEYRRLCTPDRFAFLCFA